MCRVLGSDDEALKARSQDLKHSITQGSRAVHAPRDLGVPPISQAQRGTGDPYVATAAFRPAPVTLSPHPPPRSSSPYGTGPSSRSSSHALTPAVSVGLSEDGLDSVELSTGLYFDTDDAVTVPMGATSGKSQQAPAPANVPSSSRPPRPSNNPRLQRGRAGAGAGGGAGGGGGAGAGGEMDEIMQLATGLRIAAHHQLRSPKAPGMSVAPPRQGAHGAGLPSLDLTRPASSAYASSAASSESGTPKAALRPLPRSRRKQQHPHGFAGSSRVTEAASSIIALAWKGTMARRAFRKQAALTRRRLDVERERTVLSHGKDWEGERVVPPPRVAMGVGVEAERRKLSPRRRFGGMGGGQVELEGLLQDLGL